MFTYTHAGTPEHPVLKLAGDLTLEHCREIHAVLAAPELPADVILDMREATSSDLSCIQILLALLRTSTSRVRFAPLPQHLTELAAAVGASSLIKKIRSRTEENT